MHILFKTGGWFSYGIRFSGSFSLTAACSTACSIFTSLIEQENQQENRYQRLEPFLNRFGYQKAKWYQPLLEHDLYDYLLIKPDRSFKVRVADEWSVQDRRPLFMIFWIGVPCYEKFMIYTANLEEVAQSILFDSHWPMQNLDDWTSLGLKVIAHPDHVESLRNRLNSPAMQTTLQSLLNVKASFYLFGEVSSGFNYGVALSKPLEQKAATWLSAAEKFADVFAEDRRRG